MRLYIAGIESYCLPDTKNCLIIPKNSYILTSFYYCTDKSIQYVLNTVGNNRILLDSGGYTFRKYGIEGEDIEHFTNRYIDFINKYDIKYFFEMDVDETLEDLPYIKELRNRIETKTGKKCIPVWHLTRGIEEWYKMCDEYEYIAIGDVGRLKKYAPQALKKMLRYSNSHGVKVHGLGYAVDDAASLGFYSVDASSWNGYKYGNVFYYDKEKNKPIVYKPPFKKTRLKDTYTKEVLQNNLDAWLYYQQYLKNKGYWKNC